MKVEFERCFTRFCGDVVVAGYDILPTLGIWVDDEHGFSCGHVSQCAEVHASSFSFASRGRGGSGGVAW